MSGGTDGDAEETPSKALSEVLKGLEVSQRTPRGDPNAFSGEGEGSQPRRESGGLKDGAA